MNSMKTKDWIDKYDSLVNYNLRGKSDVHQLNLPKSIDNKYLNIFNRNKIQVDNSYFLVSLNNPIVSCFNQGISGISIKTNNGIYLEDVNPYWSESVSEKNDYLFSSESVCVLVANKWGGYNYFHYIHTCLPKLSFYRKHIDLDHKLIVNSSAKFILDSLSLLKYDVDTVKIPLHVYPRIKPKILKAVSSIGYGVNPNKESCDRVRDLFKDYFLSGNKRIYISRSKANSRKILNEDKIIDMLIPLGFEIINSEDFSFLEQLQLFSQAEVIVSAHGAGLSNIVFCNPKTKILELFSPKYLGLCYWLIADSCNLDYYYLIGKGNYNDLNDYWYSNGSENIDIDVDKFKKTLDLMEII